MSLLVTGIGQLVTNRPDGADPGSLAAPGEEDLGIVSDAALVVEGGRVAWVGSEASAPACDQRQNLGGAALVPGFVDSHTHALFGGARPGEFVARMTGQPYSGSGIQNTLRDTRRLTDAALLAHGQALLTEMFRQGTTTAEIKSGYALDVAGEERLVRLAAQLTDEVTYLGAHVVPDGIDRAAYLDLVTGLMLKACAPHARWIDVFCEPAAPSAFDSDEARMVFVAGMAAGLIPRVHGNQLAPGPGVQLAVEIGAASVDHCTYVTDADLEALAGTWQHGRAEGTVATLMPGVEFSTLHPYPDARRFTAAGAVTALATDVNPGTNYCSSMPFSIALAVRELHMSPAHALWAATAGGALALRRSDVGHLGVGARAEFAVLDAPGYEYLAYRPAVPLARGWRPS